MQQKNHRSVFIAVILKVLLVNLLAALNFANVFFKIKKRLENEKRKNVFLHLCFTTAVHCPALLILM